MTRIENLSSKCVGCGVCAKVCTCDAITLRADSTGFLYPHIDNEKCVSCGACESICPALNEINKVESKYYAVRCRDEETLQKSTSGGAFSLIADQIISDGGLVCGAVLDEEFKVKHIISSDYYQMRKSKYVQSDITEVFDEIKKIISSGEKVLFSGTPCQCHAIKNYIGQNEKLYTVALICRGVQSPKFWKDYIKYLEKDGKLLSYDFRAKEKRNDAHCVTYVVGEKRTVKNYSEDAFSTIYSKTLSFRPSCYECKYCDPDTGFDFTIGDFWGVEKVFPELNDGKGNSLVIAKSKKAMDVIEKISEKALVKEVDREQILQPALIGPAKETMLTKFFAKDLATNDESGSCDIELMLKKYGGR